MEPNKFQTMTQSFIGKRKAMQSMVNGFILLVVGIIIFNDGQGTLLLLSNILGLVLFRVYIS